MFAPLRTTMVTLWMACIAGTVVVLGLAAGFVSWWLFALAAVIGVVLGAPLGLWNARRMRQSPPNIRPESPSMDPDAARRAVDPFRPEPYPPAPAQSYR